MALLQFVQIYEHFGMFFLFDLDLESTHCLPDVQALDDAKIMCFVGGKNGDYDVKFKPIWSTLSSVDAQKMYLIGEQPTWQMIIKTIAVKPWKLMCTWK